MNGEGPDDPKVPEAGDDVEDTRTPEERAKAQKRAADEWSNRHQESVDEMHRREVAQLDAEQEAERQRLLASLNTEAQALLDKVQASIADPVMAEEVANEKRKLAQLKEELRGVRAMRRQQEHEELEARRATRDTFRRLVDEEYGKTSVQQDRPIQTGQPTTQDILDHMLLVDKLRIAQGLAPKYTESIEGLKADLSLEQDEVDKYQAMRDAAADNI